MTTTALIAELVIGGIQTLGWFALLAMLWIPPARLITVIRTLNATEGVLLFVLAYGTGVVFDRLWDALLYPYHRHIKARALKKPGMIPKFRFLLFSGDPVRANFMEYLRSRMRVARSTLCNSAMAALIAAIVWQLRRTEPWSLWLALVGSFFAILALVSVYAFQNITRHYYEALEGFATAPTTHANPPAR